VEGPTWTPELEALQAEAEAEGRECVVAALVVNDDGSVFVHRRAWDRTLLPGLWDVAGGHVERGETLLQALAREVLEETGWRVTGSPWLAYVADWESGEEGRIRRRREFDFLVDVLGDLSRPRLEEGKHTEFRWVNGGSIGLLEENGGRDDGMIRHLVEVALRSARREALSFPHATLFLEAAVAGPIEVFRRSWDPAMAAQIAAHATVAYPEEVDDLDLGQLRQRVATAAGEVSPFGLRLHVPYFEDAPAGGVFVGLHDPGRGWERLRRRVAGERAILDVRPHVTLVHPRTTNRGKPAWRQLEGAAFDGEWIVRAVSVTAFDGRRWHTVDEARLRNGPLRAARLPG
jgi:8-oxo-dGTP diphosphatase